MVFFALSFLASLFGGLSSLSGIDFSIIVNVPSNPFSGIISLWPFIIALVLLLLVILWYQGIKNMQRRKNNSSARVRPGVNSVVFLGIVTVFAVVLMAAPYYLGSYAEKLNEDKQEIAPENKTEVLLTVYGMDCGGCESLVQRKVAELNGVESVSASHVRSEAFIIYDKSKVNVELIAQAIEEAGYKVAL